MKQYKRTNPATLSISLPLLLFRGKEGESELSQLLDQKAYLEELNKKLE